MRPVPGYSFLVLSLCVAAASGAADAVHAAPSERVAMPYRCGFDNGRLRLTPSREHSYTILGARDQRPYTACTGKASTTCRTFMIHRFAIACEGIRVPWARIIAAANTAQGGRVWMDGEVLNIERPKAPGESDARACVEPASHIGGPRPAGAVPECLPWKPKQIVEKMRLPNGFAPVGEIGARFIFEAPPQEDGEASVYLVAAGVEDNLAAYTAAVPAQEDHRGSAITREPLPDLGPAEPIEAGAAGEWVTKVKVRGARQGRQEDGTFFSSLLTASGALGLAIALLALGVLARFGRRSGWAGETLSSGLWQRLGQAAAGSSPPNGAGTGGTRGGDATGALLAGAAEQAGALLQESERAVLELKQATPLRDVLEDEVHVMSRRLAVLRATILDETASEEKLGGQFRALMRDLERVRKIAQSAAASLSGRSREIALMPATKSEAYDVLGVNPEVSDATLKKLVDALRMTWHPDHARDDEDRIERESRIKQINIAWDLINDRRRAA